MYAASEAFHYAVKTGAHQIPLMIFNDAVFASADINVSVGIEFNDYFNAEVDLTIGQALSNELSFNLFNDSGLLNDYEFGDFVATIGAQIGNSTITQNGVVQANSGTHTWVAYNTTPYLKRDGNAVSSQPAAPVISILIYDGYVYCRLSNGNVKVYKDSNGAYQSDMNLNSFMLSQMGKWSGKGICYVNKILKIWQGNNLKTYEFVPLGHFNAERPNVPNVIEIHFTCNDFMQRFEKDMPTASELSITYPISIGDFYVALCNYVGVQCESSVFPNSTAIITKELDDFENVTMRDVIGWIAEAAGGVARFNRDGILCISWLKTTTQVLDESDYTKFNPYWYETKKIHDLHNRSASGEYNNKVSAVTGTDAYLIQDNPLLKGVS